MNKHKLVFTTDLTKPRKQPVNKTPRALLTYWGDDKDQIVKKDALGNWIAIPFESLELDEPFNFQNVNNKDTNR